MNNREPLVDGQPANVCKSEMINSPSFDNAVATSIDDLPLEMLIEIVGYLPLRDRKMAKLVSRRWARICDDVVFSRAEKLVLCGIYGFDEILDVLMRSRRTLLNVDFHNVHFGGRSLQFWQKRGQNVRQLRFHDCTLNDCVLERIIARCDTLSHLAFVYRGERYLARNETLLSKCVIDRLVQRKLTVRSLKSLRIDLPDGRYLNNYTLFGLFSVFPAITELEFSCDNLEDSFQSVNTDDGELRSPVKLTFGSFLQKLRSSSGRIEKLDFHLNRFASFTSETLASVDDLNRLKTLTLRSDDVRPWPSQTIVDFVGKQSSLESITFVAPFSVTTGQTTKFLIRLLDNCRKLRHLELRIDEMNISDELFNKLAKSELKTLKMECTCIRVDAKTPIAGSPNRTLRNLSLYELRRNGEVSSKFIETFRNLKYLYVRYVSDAVLDAIWKYQTDLRFLIFAQSESHRYNDDIFCIRRPGICLSTSNLEYFEVETWYPKKGLVPDLIANYFPKLRYLNLGKFELYTKIDLESLEHLPYLEFLSLNFNLKEDLWHHSLVDLCSKLKNLRFLRIKSQQYSNTNFQDIKSLISDKGVVQELFACCPSIRIFIFSFWSLCGIEAYYYDVTEMKMKKIMKENEWLLDFFPNRWSLLK